MNILIDFFVFVGIRVIFSGILVFVSKRKHLLIILFRLEFIVLGVFMLLSLSFLLFNSEIYFSLFFLTLAVCEGALGISILVSLVRRHGNDYFMSFNILKC